MNFVHLHVRSHWSPNGVSSPTALAQRALEVGQSALALTDFATVAGIYEFVTACEERRIRPICGAEVPHQPHFPTLYPEGRLVPVLPMLVAADPGWSSLTGLLNRAWFDYRRAEPALRFNQLEHGCEGLFVLTGMAGTELHALLSDGFLDEAEVHLRWLQNAVGSQRLLVALEDHGLPAQQTIWRKLYQLAREYGLQTVATYGVTHAYPEDSVAAAFLANQSSPEMLNLRELRSTVSPCIAVAEEVQARFANRMAVIDATLAVADACQWRPQYRNRVPCPPLPRGLDALSTLVEKAFDGLRRRRGVDLDEEARDRLQAEIEDARESGMVESLLLLADLLEFCESHSIPTGLGSGRMLSSLLAYSLGISRIDPLSQSLVYIPFQRLGTCAPMLELEIPWRHANRIAAHLQSVYGEEYQSFVGQWDPIPIGELARQIRKWAGGDLEDSARDLLYYSHFSQPGGDGFDACFAEVGGLPMLSPEACAFLLSRIHPRPGPMSVAPGKLAVSSENLSVVCPTIPTRRGRVTQFSAETLSRLGIPIIRVEPNPALDIVDEVTRWVRENGHPKFHLDEIPLDDPDTFATLKAARTCANPPLSSTMARMIVARQAPSNLAELRRVLIEIHGAGPGEYPLHQSVADTMTAYRLAFLSTHFPAAFYAAALTASCGHSHRFHAIAAEARALRIPVLPPDITQSSYSFTPVKSGILAGLVSVRGMTREAWLEISRLRDGGPMSGLREFVNRVGEEVTPSLIWNLVHAGCFDSFAPNRNRLIEELEGILRELQESAPMNSGGPIPEISADDLIRRELEAADHLLGIETAQIYGDLWKACRALSPEAVSRRHAAKRVCVAGRITGLEPAGDFFSMPDKMIADMEGLLIAVPNEDLDRFEHALYSELPVLVMGVVEKTPYGFILTQPTFHHPDDLRWLESVVKGILIKFPAPPTLSQSAKILKLATKFVGGRAWLTLDYPEASPTAVAALSLASRSPVHPFPPLIEGLRDLLPDTAFELQCRGEVDPQTAWRCVAARRRLDPEGETKPRPMPAVPDTGKTGEF